MPDANPFAPLGKVLRHASARNRRRLGATLALMVVGALAELATIGVVAPFLALLTSAQPRGLLAVLVRPIAALAARCGAALVPTALAVMIGVAVTSSGLRLLLAWMSQRLAYDIGYDLSTRIYGRLLRQPYAYHLRNNSSHMIVAVKQVQIVVSGGLLPAMQASSSAIVGLVLVAGLVAIDPTIALFVASILALIYAALALSTRPRLRENSQVICAAEIAQMLVLREGIGGIRDVLIGRHQAIFTHAFETAEARLRDARVQNQMIASAPRFIVEASSVVLIGLTGLYVSLRPGGIVGALPALGAMAVGAQRLLPLVQQAYAGVSSVLGNAATVVNVLRYVDLAPEPERRRPAPAPSFHSSITLENVSFRYPEAERNALEAVSLEIGKGSRIGLVGATGSGKSTLADILMGLLAPSNGAMSVDGRPLDGAAMAAWQSQIAHVPQSIFLMDSSIAANIAFDLDPAGFDRPRIEAAARRAQLAGDIAALPDGFDTIIGENGVRLSGGQRQRIGIARALYRGVQVLVLDEATSALDEATEAAVMQAIDDLGEAVTVVIISHRPSALASCHRIVRLDHGRIV